MIRIGRIPNTYQDRMVSWNYQQIVPKDLSFTLVAAYRLDCGGEDMIESKLVRLIYGTVFHNNVNNSAQQYECRNPESDFHPKAQLRDHGSLAPCSLSV